MDESFKLAIHKIEELAIFLGLRVEEVFPYFIKQVIIGSITVYCILPLIILFGYLFFSNYKAIEEETMPYMVVGVISYFM